MARTRRVALGDQQLAVRVRQALARDEASAAGPAAATDDDPIFLGDEIGSIVDQLHVQRHDFETRRQLFGREEGDLNHARRPFDQVFERADVGWRRETDISDHCSLVAERFSAVCKLPGR